MGRSRGCLLEQDMFGHTVKLNFNKKGDFHATYYTAIMSVLIRLAIACYGGITVKKMVLRESDLNSSSTLPSKLNDVGPIDYMDSGIKIFYVLSKQAGKPEEGSSLVIGAKNLTKYVNINFEYHVMRSGKSASNIRIPAKACTGDDLGLSEEEATELFDAWANSTLACPAFDEIGKIEV